MTTDSKVMWWSYGSQPVGGFKKKLDTVLNVRGISQKVSVRGRLRVRK